MADSIVERITQDLVSALETVQTSNGYANNFTVERVKARGSAPEAGKTLCIVTQGQPIKLDDDSHDQSGWDQPYAIDIFVNPAEDLTTSVDALINSVRADAEKALAYAETSHNRSGLAQETRILAPILYDDIAQPGVQVRVIVRYSTAFNDPYTSAYSNIT